MSEIPTLSTTRPSGCTQQPSHLAGIALGIIVWVWFSAATSCSTIATRTATELAKFELLTGLAAGDAACILAESLAYEFPNTQVDDLRPLARAERITDDHWSIRYERGTRGFLPVANGHFERDSDRSRTSRSDSSREGHAWPEVRPTSRLLDNVRFVGTSPVGGRGAPRSIASVVIRATASGCVVQGDFVGDRASDRCARIERLVRGVDAIHTGMKLADHGYLVEAIACLRRAAQEYRAGFSHVHDPLLAAAHGALGRLEFEVGDLEGSRMSLARSRLLAPPDLHLATLEAKLGERLATVEHGAAALHRSTLAIASNGLAAREALGVEADMRALAERTRDATTCTKIARAELEAGDRASAMAWARRAQDAAPHDPNVLRMVADVAAASGAHRVADHGRRLADLEDPKSHSTDRVRDIRGIEPSLALRRLIRDGRDVMSLIDNAETRALLRQLGVDRCTRIFHTETKGEAATRALLAWFDASLDPRASFVAHAHTLARQDSENLEAREPTPLPAEVGRSSGIVFRCGVGASAQR
ncbi:MAG: hypothetical protein H6832_14200 [Planctomycetes bacterium]|nr:hypothetical protein [Planctomycetota bacterium]MCB9919550.1 hypothetical protein [Planctomycetota bacterium]